MRIRNVLGLLLASIFIFTIFFSSLFLSIEMGHHHNCTEEDCPICATIEECLNNIRVCGTAAVILICAYVVIPFVVKTVKSYKEVVQEYSLILERVRLNY